MKPRSTIMVCAATILGFLLGALCTRQTPVKAQSGMQVFVVKREANDMAKKGPTLIPGSATIVGFSCAQAGPNNLPDCFTAYVK
jgi:hypothetical protein